MTDSVNRGFFLVLSLVLLAGGIVGVLAHGGSIHVDQPSKLYSDAKSNIVADVNTSVAITVAVCIVVLLVALWILRKQTGIARQRKPHTLTKTSDNGLTRFEPTVIEKAIEYELSRPKGVSNSKVRLSSAGSKPSFAARMSLYDDADLASIEAGFQDACARAGKNLDVESIDGTIRMVSANSPHSRVE